MAALAAALLLAGCASYKGIEPEATLRTPQSLGLSGEPAAQRLAPDWWKAFGDEQLDRLVAQALAGNPTLKVAQARLRRAQSVLEVANAATLPQVNGSFDVTRQRYSENGLLPPPIAGSIRESATLQLGASWEIDFFGKYSEALEAALGTARAAQADTEAARILLAANVTRSYIQLARVHDQLAVARRALAQREEALKLVRDRVNAGLDTALELKQAEGALPEARQQIEALQEQAQLARNALSALVAQPDAKIEERALAAIKPVPAPHAIPSDLLARRADVAAARWRAEAATHDVASAKAQFYPSINLTAFLGLSSLGIGKLLDAGSLQWGMGPAVHLPIFDAGRLRANLRGRAADLDAAVEGYNATLVDAIREAADQVATLQSIEKQRAEQRDAQAAAEGAYDIAVQRYRAGLGTYLNVLTAETAVLNQRRLAVDLAGRQLDAQVQLMRALGGGYESQGI
ncbi:efflux transporter outer membrane subunit [Ramlibacter sp. GTP1]|uniref:Efflux transporter outer membrane subunit n=2 Tax=Ramlibacter albus TaxID=2079448 RepID=A0A923MEK7_9BURK|nr:efflux transporter outer membrane subunit [Ramlibacter albus]